MGSAKRKVSPALREAWDLALGHADPLIALAAARAVRAHLANWESELAAEAVAGGATWETIGEAVGVSRQAAWERFRPRAPQHTAEESVAARYAADVQRLRDEVDRLKRKARDTRSLAHDPSRRR